MKLVRHSYEGATYLGATRNDRIVEGGPDALAKVRAFADGATASSRTKERLTWPC